MEKLFKGTSVTAFRIHWTTCPSSDVLHSQIGAWGGGGHGKGERRGERMDRGDHLQRKKCTISGKLIFVDRSPMTIYNNNYLVKGRAPASHL